MKHSRIFLTISIALFVGCHSNRGATPTPPKPMELTESLDNNSRDRVLEEIQYAFKIFVKDETNEESGVLISYMFATLDNAEGFKPSSGSAHDRADKIARLTFKAVGSNENYRCLDPDLGLAERGECPPDTIEYNSSGRMFLPSPFLNHLYLSVAKLRFEFKDDDSCRGESSLDSFSTIDVKISQTNLCFNLTALSRIDPRYLIQQLLKTALYAVSRSGGMPVTDSLYVTNAFDEYINNNYRDSLNFDHSAKLTSSLTHAAEVLSDSKLINDATPKNSNFEVAKSAIVDLVNSINFDPISHYLFFRNFPFVKLNLVRSLISEESIVLNYIDRDYYQNSPAVANGSQSNQLHNALPLDQEMFIAKSYLQVIDTAWIALQDGGDICANIPTITPPFPTSALDMHDPIFRFSSIIGSSCGQLK